MSKGNFEEKEKLVVGTRLVPESSQLTIVRKLVKKYTFWCPQSHLQCRSFVSGSNGARSPSPAIPNSHLPQLLVSHSNNVQLNSNSPLTY
jgi:hypothetical protein